MHLNGLKLCLSMWLVMQQNTSSENETEVAPEDKTTPPRHGRLLLLSLSRLQSSIDGSSGPPDTKLCMIEATDTSAILDVKWSNDIHGDNPSFGVVDAAGDLSVWELKEAANPDDVSSPPRCHLWNRLSLGSDCLVLSLDWSNQVHHGYVNASWHKLWDDDNYVIWKFLTWKVS